MPVREHPGTNQTKMTAVHRSTSHLSAVTDITISQRDKGFITTDAEGEIRLHHGRLHRRYSRYLNKVLRSTHFSPKADGPVSVSENNHLLHYHIGTISGKSLQDLVFLQ